MTEVVERRVATMLPRSAGILPALLPSVAQALLPVRRSLRRNPPILAHARNRTQQSQETASRHEGNAGSVGSRPPTFNLLVPMSIYTRFYVTLRYTNDQIRATMVRFYMTTKTALSDEETAQRRTHPWLPQGPTARCAFDAPSIQGKSHTVQSRDAEFLIANPELEFKLNHRKHSDN